jgi:hypothetical protein
MDGNRKDIAIKETSVFEKFLFIKEDGEIIDGKTKCRLHRMLPFVQNKSFSRQKNVRNKKMVTLC